MTAAQGHRSIDHTADLAFALWAPSEADLLLEGARAIVGELVGGAAVQPLTSRHLQLTALDRGDRLVRWLNEVLVWAVLEGFLVADAELTLGSGTLRAVAHGESDATHRIEQELKSVTYHDLILERDHHGTWQAQIVVDV